MRTPGAKVDLLARKVASLSRLVEISVNLNSTLDPEQLLQAIIDTAADLLETEAASILLFDVQTHELHFSAATGSDPKELAKIPVPLEGSLAGTIFRENRPVIINDVRDDPRHFKQVGQKIQFEVRSLLGVPMRTKERITGVLEAINKKQGVFTDDDASTLAILASQAAVAIENARLLDEVQRAYVQLGKVDKLKSDFVAIASHELRTPLGVILGYATFLNEEAQGPAREYAQKVLEQAAHMRDLIEAMTNLRYLEIGQAQISRARTDVNVLLVHAQQDLVMMAEARRQRLLLDPPTAPLPVAVDQAKLETVLTNLITNAIRFTAEGGVIGMRAFAKGGEAWVQVADTGVGIPAGELERIFEQFHQVEDHMTRQVGGLGVGLAIVRGIVNLHGGRVWAESAGPGKGSTFTFTLPLARDAATGQTD